MHHRVSQIFVIGLVLALSSVASAERVKDLVSIAGVRSNQLLGYGLVEMALEMQAVVLRVLEHEEAAANPRAFRVNRNTPSASNASPGSTTVE